MAGSSVKGKGNACKRQEKCKSAVWCVGAMAHRKAKVVCMAGGVPVPCLFNDLHCLVCNAQRERIKSSNEIIISPSPVCVCVVAGKWWNACQFSEF